MIRENVKFISQKPLNPAPPPTFAQTFHEKERNRRHHREQQQQHQAQQQAAAAVPFELSPIPRPETLFTTSTPTLHEAQQLEVNTRSGRGQTGGQLTVPESVADPTLPSPASAVASLTRDLEQSLSLQSAMRGQFVVKPQVTVWTFCLSVCVLFPRSFSPFSIWFLSRFGLPKVYGLIRVSLAGLHPPPPNRDALHARHRAGLRGRL